MLGSSEHGIYLHSNHIVSFAPSILISFPRKKKQKAQRFFFHLSCKENLLNTTWTRVFYCSAVHTVPVWIKSSVDVTGDAHCLRAWT